MNLIVRWRGSSAAVFLLALAACSGGGTRPGAVPAPVASAAADAEGIVMLLNQGDESAARKRIKALLKREPMNASARLLNDSIEGDPKELMGPSSYPYTVRAGDTITGLAERLLGNRLKSYQLARYNGLKAPVTLAPGQVVRIPAEPVRPRADPRPAPQTARPSAPKPETQIAKPAKPVAPVADPAAARPLRAAGLTALNQGNVARAVGLLRRARTLDPGNALIARDLARAERIAATVQARR